MSNKYYAVKTGRTPGIYATWAECQSQVNGVSNVRFKSFTNRADAEAFLNGTSPAESTEAVPHSTDAITLYTDGGSRNHGNQKGDHVHANDRAAWAYLITLPNGEQHSDAGSELGATNNRMEIMALLNGLTALAAANQFTTPIEVVADSKYVLDAIKKGWLTGWQRRGWRKADGQPVKNVALWQQVLALLERFQHLQFEWTKGHADNAGNQFVDQLLNKAMDHIGQSGTIQVATPEKSSGAPKADPAVQKDAAANIDRLLNHSAEQPDHSDDSTTNHRLSVSESVDNIQKSLQNLNQDGDNQ